MGLFSIDIERLFQDLSNKGQKLKGMFCIQYPIYCIHANITDSTPDPLESVDKVIVDFLASNPRLTPLQIGHFMGTSSKIIDRRIYKLQLDNLLKQEGSKLTPTEQGISVFKDKSSVRLHNRSYDFYLDGVTLQPLPKFYYTYYRAKFLSEDNILLRTSKSGETYTIRLFAPDIVHTPPDRQTIINNINKIEGNRRDEYSIPAGLTEINEISFNKLSLNLLVAVSESHDKLIKELIDGFALHSLKDNISYYESAKRNINIFEESLKSRLDRLVFKIVSPKRRSYQDTNQKVFLTSNWHEVDRYEKAEQSCFSFSSEDLNLAITQFFSLSNLVSDNVVNTDKNIEINVTKAMLLESSNRTKVIDSLIRGRDYKVFNHESSLDKNVFLIYLYFNTNDPFVRETVELKKLIYEHQKNNGKVNLDWINSLNVLSHDYRQLLIAAGEYDILEKLDIERYMQMFK